MAHEEPAPILVPRTAFEPATPLAIGAPLEACFAGGGRLTLAAAIDNDDVREHGALRTLAAGADGRIVVAADDGTLKLWTLEGFLGELSPGNFLYGVETGATPASDVLFSGARVIAGDVRGLVSSWETDGTFQVLGGTDPDVAIVAVAMDRSGAWLAHADARGSVMVRSMGDVTVFGPLPTELTSVRDLAYLADGSLLVAGAGGLELRGAEDPTLVRASVAGDEIVEVAAARDRVAAVSAARVSVLDGSLRARWSAEAPFTPVSVALSPMGRFVAIAGADGSLRVHDAEDGSELDVADVADPVVVRVDPRGAVILVGERDGRVSAWSCAQP